MQPYATLILQPKMKGGMIFKKSLKCFNMWNQQEEKSKDSQDQIDYSEEMFNKPEVEVPVENKDQDLDDKI